MNTWRLWGIAGWAALMTSCAMLFGGPNVNRVGSVPPGVNRVALIVSESRGFPDRLVESEIFQQLLRKGYRVPSRSDLLRVQEEIGMGALLDKPKELGNKLGADALMVVSLVSQEKFTEEGKQRLSATIEARLVEVNGGEVLWAGTAEDAMELTGRTSTLFVRLASSLARAVPSPSS